jgi:hypothetical protein
MRKELLIAGAIILILGFIISGFIGTILLIVGILLLLYVLFSKDRAIESHRSASAIGTDYERNQEKHQRPLKQQPKNPDQERDEKQYYQDKKSVSPSNQSVDHEEERRRKSRARIERELREWGSENKAKRCPNCGSTSNPNNAQFCADCGTRL